jgi:hypothetical protein
LTPARNRRTVLRMAISTLFALLVAYQLKHFLCDYPLQTNRYMLGKFLPGWEFVLPLLAHVGVHAAGTVLIAWLFGAPAWLIPLVAIFDASVHFVMDRIKASPRWMGRWKPLTAAEYVRAQHVVEATPDNTEGITFSDVGAAGMRLWGNALFWNCLGVDQAVHHLTHYACIWAIAGFPS